MKLNNYHKHVFIYLLRNKGCREPRAPLNCPGAPSNICREPKYVLVSIHNTFRRCNWAPRKILSPDKLPEPKS